MLYVAEYELEWEMLEAAIAKRLDWLEVQPEDFELLSEYVWQSGAPAFRGVAVIEVGSVESLHAYVLHYGPAVTFAIHPATDVVSSIALVHGEAARD